MSRINREELLQQLEAVQPGLSPREIVEQSSCFVFKDGLVMTYNDEISCSHSTNLKIEGAVQAAPLLSLLRKMIEEEIDVQINKETGELQIVGKRRHADLRMDKEILLPTETVERPTKWKKLPEEFPDAINIVQQCAGKDESNFNLTCVHIHPEWLEASDNYQITRYKIATPVKKPTLVRRDSIKHIVSLGMTEISETETWMHFRNPDGLVLSCRRFAEQFPDLSPFLKVKGQPATLPKGLVEATERAEIFSSENVDNDQVLVILKAGKLTIKGEGASGRYTEKRSIKYSGTNLSFRISPKLLIELTKRYNECQISEDRIKVDGGGKFVYVTCLGANDD